MIKVKINIHTQTHPTLSILSNNVIPTNQWLAPQLHPLLTLTFPLPAFPTGDPALGLVLKLWSIQRRGWPMLLSRTPCLVARCLNTFAGDGGRRPAVTDSPTRPHNHLKQMFPNFLLQDVKSLNHCTFSRVLVLALPLKSCIIVDKPHTWLGYLSSSAWLHFGVDFLSS